MSSAVLLCDDLIFTSRIRGTAESFGGTMRVVRTVDEVVQIAQSESPVCVIVDLQLAGPRIGELMESLKKLPQPPRVIGYGSHVDKETLKSAREVGCDAVMARSLFVARLPTEMQQWLSAGSSEPEA